MATTDGVGKASAGVPRAAATLALVFPSALGGAALAGRPGAGFALAEMSHRVKNLLLIASGLTEIASRESATMADMERDLANRLTALGRAHDLVHPAPGQDTQAALPGDLLTVLLAPYADKGSFNKRVCISVPKVAVGAFATTTLALVVHELATNSLKYGALSVPSSTLDVSCPAEGNDVVLLWTERGGPSVVAPAAPAGFGSKMVTRSMTGRLGGSIAFDWPKQGVIATLRMNKDRLAA